MNNRITKGRCIIILLCSWCPEQCISVQLYPVLSDQSCQLDEDFAGTGNCLKHIIQQRISPLFKCSPKGHTCPTLHTDYIQYCTCRQLCVHTHVQRHTQNINWRDDLCALIVKPVCCICFLDYILFSVLFRNYTFLGGWKPQGP